MSMAITAVASLPALFCASTVGFVAASVSRSATTTCAPRCVACRAVAWPTPLPPPTTTTTRRLNSFSGGWRLIFARSEEHTSELQSRGHLVCRLLLEKKKYQSLIGFSLSLVVL